jgi:Mlc titration factor MtfA (ptsG expression regulator)
MSEAIFTVLTFLLAAIVILLVIAGFIRLFVEPAYVLIFNKPLYIHWYPVPKKVIPFQRQILEREFSFYRKLSDKRKVYFEHRVKSFLMNYQFHGKDISVTEEMKVMIAGTYVMLTFGMRFYLTPLFRKIIIYPGQYTSVITQQNHKGEFNLRLKAVVFSWEDFLSGHNTTNDNVNLGLHEFAHVLHFHSKKTNGDPNASIFYDEFNEIVKYYDDAALSLELVQRGYFREYAYENKFEFLAVLLEHFFESPQVFRKEYPELYERVKKMINFKEEYLN